jgi:small-conductance mechanosensitive channel
MKGSQVEFQIGDNVREGIHVGTVTDVGTVLIQVKTTDGRVRVVCPWELVPIRSYTMKSRPTRRQNETSKPR